MTKKETYVKPHKRRNKKKEGTHRVSGHTRKLGHSKDKTSPKENWEEKYDYVIEWLEDAREKDKEINQQTEDLKKRVKEKYGKSWYQLSPEDIDGEDVALAQELFRKKVETIHNIIEAEYELPPDIHTKELGRGHSPGSIWNAWMNELKPLDYLGFVYPQTDDALSELKDYKAKQKELNENFYGDG